MTGTQLEVGSAVIGALMLIFTTIRQVRKEAKAAAAADADEKQKIYNRGMEDGQKSRDDTIALLRSQRDDARLERDDLRKERDDERRQKAELEKEMRDMLRRRGNQ